MCPIQINILKTILLKCYILKKNEFDWAADKAYSHSQSIFGIKYYLKQFFLKKPQKTKQRKKKKISRHRDGELLFLYFDIILKRIVRRRYSADQN